jgi:hypothetical protein
MYKNFALCVWGFIRGVTEIVVEVGRMIVKYLLFSEDEGSKEEKD